MAFTGTGGVWAMKRGDFQATNFAGTSSGLLQAAEYIRLGGGGEMRAIGTIQITEPIALGNNCLFRGWGGRSSLIIEAAPSFAGSAMITNFDQVGGQQWCAVENMSIWGNKSNGATVTYLIYFKSIGQPSRIRDVSGNAGSNIGIWVEGGATNAGNFLIENTGVSNCLNGSFVISGISAGYTLRDVDAEFVSAGVAAFLIDGPWSGDLFPGTVLIDGCHIEGLLAGSIGVHVKSSRNVHVKDLIYFGTGSNGDLVKITGTAATVQNFIAENITAYVGACANGLVDSVNGYTRASDGNGVNISRYEIGAPRLQGSPVIIGNTAITGDLTVTGNETVTGTLGVTGAITGDANATFGTAGVAEVVTVGKGGANAAGADLIVDSGNTGATQARWLLRRSGQSDLLAVATGTNEQIQFRNSLQFGTTAGAQVAVLSATSKLRIASSGNPTDALEVVGTAVVDALKVGGGTNIVKVISATVSLDFDLTAVTSQDLTITVTGAASGDCVHIGVPSGSVTADTAFFGWVSAANTVTIRAFRLAGTPNPASGTFRATVIQF